MSIKNNNPGNIRSANNNWDGSIGTEKGFEVFESPEYGVRAMAKLLKNYDIQYGLDTIEGIISRYAPANENNTKAYIKNVSSFTGFNSKEQLDLENPEVMKKLLQAIIRQENKGKNHFSDEFYNEVLQMEGIDMFSSEARPKGGEADPMTNRESREIGFPSSSNIDNGVGMDNQKTDDPRDKERENLKNYLKITSKTIKNNFDSIEDGKTVIEKLREIQPQAQQEADKLKQSRFESRKRKEQELINIDLTPEEIEAKNKAASAKVMGRGEKAFNASTELDANLNDDLGEGYEEKGIFEYLFGDDVTLDYDTEFEADTLNLKEGGEVEADFVKTKDEQDEEEDHPADPPPGATPKEVADDIPAMLSEGEYVLPANVVRYLGLERIMEMHQRVLHEIQQMEDLGMIQNVDEKGDPENDDDEMKFVEPKEDEEAISKGTLIIASSRPTGIMSKEPIMLKTGGPTDPADEAADASEAAGTQGEGPGDQDADQGFGGGPSSPTGAGGVGADGTPNAPGSTQGPGATENGLGVNMNSFPGGVNNPGKGAIGSKTAGKSMTGPEGHVVDHVAGNPKTDSRGRGLVKEGTVLSTGFDKYGRPTGVDVSGLPGNFVSLAQETGHRGIAQQAVDFGLDEPRDLDKMGLPGQTREQTLDEIVDARLSNDPTDRQLDLNAQTEAGFQAQNPGMAAFMGMALTIASFVPGVGIAIAMGKAISNATAATNPNFVQGPFSRSLNSGVGGIFSGLASSVGVDVSGLSVPGFSEAKDAVGNVVDGSVGNLMSSLQDLAEKVGGDRDDTPNAAGISGGQSPTSSDTVVNTDEPSSLSQQTIDAFNQTTNLATEAGGDSERLPNVINPVETMVDNRVDTGGEIFIPGVGLVPSETAQIIEEAQTNQGIMSPI